ncbi:MAG TPA: hypothetical protein VD793_08710, partial [Gemmatimonadales bacterium]|nr:hypothetical protein [Gemmatimonadales bacterium]
PALGGWFRPRAGVSAGFTLLRDPNTPDVSLTRDSAGAPRLPLAITNYRRQELGARVDPARMLGATQAAAGRRWVDGLLRAFQPAEVSFTADRRSSFDRLPAVPSGGYQLGMGGEEDFRRQFGVPAATAGEAATWTAAAGLQTALGGRVRFTYRNVDGTTWIRRAGEQLAITQATREWPSFAASWTTRFGGAPAGPLVALDARLMHRDLHARTRQEQAAGGAVQTTEQRTRVWTPTLALTWLAGLTTGGQYHRSQSEQMVAGTRTTTWRQDWGANVGFAFAPPAWLVRLESPLRATLAGSGSAATVCVLRTGTDGCTTVADSRRRQVDVRVDTGFSPAVVGGLSFSYILNDQRHLSSRFSQIVFTVFADVSLVAGRIP